MEPPKTVISLGRTSIQCFPPSSFPWLLLKAWRHQLCASALSWLKGASKRRLEHGLCRSSEISEHLSYKNLLEEHHWSTGSGAGPQGLVPSSLETRRALQSYQNKQTKTLNSLLPSPVWGFGWVFSSFHPEGNDAPMAFCTHCRDDARAVWTKHQRT